MKIARELQGPGISARRGRAPASPVALALLITPFVTLAASDARAGTLSKHGAVQVLDHVSQLENVTGEANFDAGPHDSPVALDAYAEEGALFHLGPLSDALAGVETEGSANQPMFYDWVQLGYFPAPIAGGGQTGGLQTHFAGVVTFSETVTQFGLTASSSGPQYLTAWDSEGVMLGQVDWAPAGDAAFVGIDSLGVPIGMIAFGNDDLWAGETYSVAGAAIISDHWRWGVGSGCVSNADCDDGDPCTGVELCMDGSCVQAEQTLDCADDNPCTDDLCEPGIGCVHTTNDAPCDDGDACTEDDICADGACEGAPISCEDGQLCSLDSCDPLRGCVSETVDGCCESDADCAPDEQCDLAANSCEPTDDPTTASTGDSGGGADTSLEPDDDSDDSDDGASNSDGDAPGSAGTDSAADDTLTDDGCGCRASRGAREPALAWLLLLPICAGFARRRRQP